MKNIILMLAASACYWAGFREGILGFQIASWSLLVFSFIILSLSTVLAESGQVDKELKELKTDFGLSYFIVGGFFTILNLWITWGSTFFYAYAIVFLLSLYFVTTYFLKTKI